MNILTLILSAGSQTRWSGHHPKQLLPLPSGERILNRLERQAKEYGLTYVVSRNAQVLEHARGRVFLPESNRYISETFLSTKELWKKFRIVVLLGDVVFEDKHIEYIYNERKPFRWYSSDKEIFAFSFTPSEREKVQLLFVESLIYCEKKERDLRLWHVFRNSFEERIILDGKTSDVDNPAKYEDVFNSFM